MKLFRVLGVIAALTTSLLAQGTGSSFSPARPPAIPLAVRFPYLSTWLRAGTDGGNGGYLAGEWPIFWTGQITGWTGVVRVDGLNYIWMGAPTVDASLVNQTAFSYTSTRSTFTMNINQAVGMTIEFLSPVLPNHMKRQALPFSYMNVEVWSLDGDDHSVQLYTDVSAEWVSGNRGDVAQWDYSVINGKSGQTTDDSNLNDRRGIELEERDNPFHYTYGTRTSFQTTVNPRPTTTYSPYRWQPQPYSTWNIETKSPTTTHTSPTSTISATPTASGTPTASAVGGIAVHHVFKQTQQLFSESSDQAEWGDFYYSTANVANLTFQSGADATVRNQFINTGKLSNGQDTNFRAINNAYPVFGFAIDLGSVTPVAVSTLFTVGLVQKEVIQFEGATNQTLNAYWTNYFNNNNALISFFYNDYIQAGKFCTTLDNKVQTDSVNAAGQNYATITTLSVRQAFGGLQLTGTTADPLVFLKEISSDGNVNTVDVIFPTHPILLYLSPQWLRLLLEPLYINQEAGNWPYAYSIHDIGNHYPNATGHSDGMDEMQPLEECGDMIIMTLAYAQRANDSAYLSTHYDLLRQWNEYLIEEALIPANQISTDDFAGSLANQTNLAIKGIIGIAAMAEIANRTGNIADGQNYTNIALSYIKQWQTLAVAQATTNLPAHTTLNYGNTSSYSLLYNLWADRALSLGLVPQSIYDMQSAFYPYVANEYGVPLDTRHTYTKSDWEIFCAAVAKTSTRDLFVQKVASYINQTPSSLPFGDWYDTISGLYMDFIARPVVGGEFAILALKSAPNKDAL